MKYEILALTSEISLIGEALRLLVVSEQNQLAPNTQRWQELQKIQEFVIDGYKQILDKYGEPNA